VATDAVEHRVHNTVTPPKDKENDSQRTAFKLVRNNIEEESDEGKSVISRRQCFFN
jgi:hypothetical protein